MPDESDITTTAGGNSVAVTNVGHGNVELNLNQAAPQISSILNPLIIHLVAEFRPSFQSESDLPTFPETEDKISFNSVKVYADIIREGSGYMALVEQALDSIDDQDPMARETMLWAIKRHYASSRADLFVECSIDPGDTGEAMSCIRNNADRLIKLVTERILSSTPSSVDAPTEYIEAVAQLVVCYGFINCHILETPT